MSDPSNQNRQIQPTSPGFWADVIRQIRLTWRLLLDSRVPLWLKAIVPAALIYVISPIDFIPDAIVGLGQLDDLAVLIIGIKFFIELCPPAIVREHMQQLLGEATGTWSQTHPSLHPLLPRSLTRPTRSRRTSSRVVQVS